MNSWMFFWFLFFFFFSSRRRHTRCSRDWSSDVCSSEIAGYTDNTGSPTLNRRLSQARADRVRAYLASKGVSPSRMIARGYGPANPIAPNTTAAGRAQNPRVERHKPPEAAGWGDERLV